MKGWLRAPPLSSNYGLHAPAQAFPSIAAILQRVLSASVTVEKELVSSIGKGVLVFAAVAPGDTEKEADSLAAKVLKMRLWDDETGGRVWITLSSLFFFASRFETAHMRAPSPGPEIGARCATIVSNQFRFPHSGSIMSRISTGRCFAVRLCRLYYRHVCGTPSNSLSPVPLSSLPIYSISIHQEREQT